MNELLKDMGQRILDRRKQLNMTQETLANLTHLTSQTISYAETGQKAMRPETMLKICDALGISADYLLRGEILEANASLLQQKISTLTPSQYRHLEQIIDHFIAATQEKEDFCGKPPLCWQSNRGSYHQLPILHLSLRLLIALSPVLAAVGLFSFPLMGRFLRPEHSCLGPVSPGA